MIGSIDASSDAYHQGLRVGDAIVEANDIDLSKTSRHDADKILRAAKMLTLTVHHVGQSVSSDE